MKTLDSRIPNAGAVVWRTVVKDGQKWTLQVHLIPSHLERLVAESIDENQESHAFSSGPLLVELVRQP